MRRIAAVAILTVIGNVPLAAQTSPTNEATVDEAAASDKAAVVNGRLVTWAEVEQELRRAFGQSAAAASGGATEPQADPPQQTTTRQSAARRNAALTQVIDRRLVLDYLQRTSQAASEQDVDFAMARLEKGLQAQSQTLDDHCRALGMTSEQLRHQLAWQLSWQRYLARQQSDENLAKYFDRHRRDFDGTRLRVAQILLKPSADQAASLAKVNVKALALRQEIAGGKLAFADAARKHSQAPSAASGGDIGWIERRQPMPEDFSLAAFALQVGEVSQPLESPFGVHLITVLEEKPGTKAWQDVVDELRPAVALYLFRWIASRERETAKIELIAHSGEGNSP